MIPLRIGLTGAGSTGKTSVLNALKITYPKYNYISEVARKFDIRAEGENRTAVQIKILRAHIGIENKYYSSGFISDRCVIDHLAYFMAIDEKYRCMETGVYNDIVEMRLGYMYDLIFYFPIEFPIVADGFRFEDTDFQVDIGRRILSIMKQKNVKYHTVTGPVRDRVKYILDIIKTQSLNNM